MKGFRLRTSDTQRQRILDYLGTDLGPTPPPVSSEVAPVSALAADGAALFSDTCAVCHQGDGSGKADEFPPLAGNPDMFLSRNFPAFVVINGIAGEIPVKGEVLDSAMPPFDFLSDAEIAAALAYVRSQWGNDMLRPEGMEDLDAAGVSEVRPKPMSPGDVAAMGAELPK